MPSITRLLREIAVGHEIVAAEHADEQLPGCVAQLLAQHFVRMVSAVPTAEQQQQDELSIDEPDDLPAAGAPAGVAGMLSAALEAPASGSAPGSSSSRARGQAQATIAPGFTPVSEFVASVTRQSLSELGLELPQQLYATSPPLAAIPFLRQVQAAASASAAAAAEEERQHALLVERVQRLVSVELPERLAAARSSRATEVQAAQAEWERALQKLAPQVERMGEVLQTAVLPPNKRSRTRAALRGPSLHMGGLIKAVATDFDYKKIFAQRCRGSKRKYGVAIVLDTSLSMHGQRAHCAMDALVTLVGALTQHLGCDSFALLTFGQGVRLMKGPDDPWDGAAMLALLSQLHFDVEASSQDAAAVDAAVTLLLNSGTGGKRAPKKVFVLTDGYGSTGLQLAAALGRAEAAGVEVVGVAVGLERTHVRRCYGRWVQAALSSELPDALEQLYGAAEDAAGRAGDGGEDGAGVGAEDAAQKWADYSALLAAGDDDVEAILRNHDRFFGDVFNRLSECMCNCMPKLHYGLHCRQLVKFSFATAQVAHGTWLRAKQTHQTATAENLHHCRCCLDALHPVFRSVRRTSNAGHTVDMLTPSASLHPNLTTTPPPRL